MRTRGFLLSIFALGYSYGAFADHDAMIKQKDKILERMKTVELLSITIRETADTFDKPIKKHKDLEYYLLELQNNQANTRVLLAELQALVIAHTHYLLQKEDQNVENRLTDETTRQFVKSFSYVSELKRSQDIFSEKIRQLSLR